MLQMECRASRAIMELPVEERASEAAMIRLSLRECILEGLVYIPGSKEVDADEEALRQIKAYFTIEGRPELAENVVAALERFPSRKEGMTHHETLTAARKYLRASGLYWNLPPMTVDWLVQPSVEDLIP
ncbi:MAG: hypothetical protein ACI4NA_06695 [Succinivibrio sp.]